LQEQLTKAFPRARVARVDRDTLSSEGEMAADCDLYVTTWIGTKESLRPPVSLVGVLDADLFIRRPNFRAAESAYQALSEMAEWAGPAASGGQLIVQCSDPGHHAIQALVRADHDYFVERELELRRELDYPPFSELVIATAFGPDARKLIDAAATAARAGGGVVLGPIPLRNPETGEESLQVLVKCKDPRAVTPGQRDILIGAPRGSRLRIDVDPR
jgi:primosomal protein N' (replication factor Y)